MRCTSCGSEFPDGTAFCPNCGTKAAVPAPVPAQSVYDPNQSYQSSMPPAAPTSYGSYNPNVPYQPPMQQGYNPMSEDLKPISPWGYIGYNFLFSIPLVGLVLLFVYAFGGSTNRNLKNYARSILIMMAIVIVLYIILFVILGAGIASTGIFNSSEFSRAFG